MKVWKWAWVGLAVASMAVAGLAAVQSANAVKGNTDDAKAEISLQGSPSFPDANGKARFEDRGGEQRFRVEVEDVEALAGQTLDVFVGATDIGDLTLDGFGDGRLSLNSDLGDTVPSIVVGSQVMVKAGDTLVVSGEF